MDVECRQRRPSFVVLDDGGGAQSFGGAIYAPDPADERGTRIYFDVDDINAGGARVKELGGEAGEALPVPGMGWFSLCKDTEGNEFGLWQTDLEAPTPSQ